jgi:hypothetical protein
VTFPGTHPPRADWVVVVILAWAGAKRRKWRRSGGRVGRQKEEKKKKQGEAQSSPQDPGTDAEWLFAISFLFTCLPAHGLPRVPSHVLNPPIAPSLRRETEMHEDPPVQQTPSHLDAAGVTFRFSYSLSTGLALAALGGALNPPSLEDSLLLYSGANSSRRERIKRQSVTGCFVRGYSPCSGRDQLRLRLRRPPRQLLPRVSDLT